MTPRRSDGATCYALVCGGGTGGHVQPALAVAEALVARGHARSTIHFVGSRRGMEGRLVPEAGFEVTLLPGRGIRRRLTLANLGAVAGLSAACAIALGVVRRHRPAVVITVGGYAGFPPSFAALVERVPVVVVSYDAVAGAANRWIGRFAAVNAVAYPGSPLPRARLTGPPVREHVLAVDRSPAGRAVACEELGIDPERRVILATGGSLGSRTINTAVVEMCRQWADRSDVTVYHVAGERNHDDVRAAAADAGLEAAGTGAAGTGAADTEPAAAGSRLDYRLVGYEDRMDLVLAACDVAVARAGASTVAEMCAIGVPTVLVPLPRSPGDHQAKNAAALAGVGASVTIADEDCSGSRLAEVVTPLLSSPELLATMSSAATALGHRDAADQIALLAMTVAKRAA